MEYTLECHEARLPNLGLPAVGLVRWFSWHDPLARLTTRAAWTCRARDSARGVIDTDICRSQRWLG
jgi:hypothetical protein